MNTHRAIADNFNPELLALTEPVPLTMYQLKFTLTVLVRVPGAIVGSHFILCTNPQFAVFETITLPQTVT
ncbi:hypothetical protein H6G27_31665 [Nostoc linckia FACHB-104]|nr:hypothetical protein [Nostoc linckia FACHB-104]